jgi:hypothetical protein
MIESARMTAEYYEENEKLETEIAKKDAERLQLLAQEVCSCVETGISLTILNSHH